MRLKVVRLLRHLVELEGCTTSNAIPGHLILLALVEEVAPLDNDFGLGEYLSLLNGFLEI